MTPSTAAPAAPAADSMYKAAYFAVERILDGALGTGAAAGTGEGHAADVQLLVQQRDAARAERDQLLRFTAWLASLDDPASAEARRHVSLSEVIARAAAAAADGSDGTAERAEAGEKSYG